MVMPLALIEGNVNGVADPPSEIACGLPGALSVIVRNAALNPAFDGPNTILIVQLAPGASEPTHPLVNAKSPGFVPVIATLEIVNAAAPLFVMVTVCAGLVVPASRLVNVSSPGDRKSTRLNSSHDQIS